MVDYIEGDISRIPDNAGSFIHRIISPITFTNPSNGNMLSADVLIDTGADRSIISYAFGNELGLDAPADDIIHHAKDANNNDVPYIIRKVDMYLDDDIEKYEVDVCWCISPKISGNFLGMDFFDIFKLIIHGGNEGRFFIAKKDKCVGCRI